MTPAELLGNKTSGPALACALMISGNTLSMQQSARALGLDAVLRGAAGVGSALRRLGTHPHWPDILAAIAAIAQYLDHNGSPIDYRRRRSLDYRQLLPTAAWEQIRTDAGMPLLHHRWRQVARCFLFQRISGLPAAAAPAEMTAGLGALRWELRLHSVLLTPDLLNLLTEAGTKFLHDLGVTDEPLTWEPPPTLAAYLQLPGPDPAQVDIDKLHELIREQPMSAMHAADHYGLPPDVITYVLERGLEQEMRPPAWHGRAYRHKDAPSLVLPRQQISPQLFTQLYTDQRLSLGEMARRYDTTRFVIKRLAREYGIILRPHNAPQFVIGQEWLYEQYVVHKRSMSSIAESIGMGDHIVLRWLIIYQIPRRPPGGASHDQAIMLRDEAQHVPDLLRPALTGTRGWKRLDNLVVLSGHANFQSAANSIGCHYTTLKDNIRQLETALGQRLVHRAQANRPLRLTDAGLAVIQAVADFRQA